MNDPLSLLGGLLGGAYRHPEYTVDEQRARDAYQQAVQAAFAQQSGLYRGGAPLRQIGAYRDYSSAIYNPAQWQEPLPAPPMTFDQQCAADARRELEDYLGPMPDVVVFDVRFAGSEE